MLRLTDADVRDSLPHGLIWTEKLWRAVTWNNKLNLKLIRVLSADQSGDYIYIERVVAVVGVLSQTWSWAEGHLASVRSTQTGHMVLISVLVFG